MSRALMIDFAPRGRAPTAGGAALLALALALAAGMLWHHRGLTLEAARLEAKLESQQLPQARRGSGKAPAPEAAAELVRANHVLRQLATPWNELFAAVEGAVGEHVALLGIQPDPAGARVTLSGEARSIGEALWFAQRLAAGGTLADAFLTGHEFRRDGAQRPVRFTLSARWVALEGAAAVARGAAP